MNKLYLIASYIYNPILLFWCFNRISEFSSLNVKLLPILFVIVLLITAIVSLFRANSVYNFHKQLKIKSKDVLDDLEDTDIQVSRLWRTTTIGNLIFGFLLLGIFSYMLYFIFENNINWFEYYDSKLIGFFLFAVVSVFFSLIKTLFYLDLTRKIS